MSDDMDAQTAMADLFADIRLPPFFRGDLGVEGALTTIWFGPRDLLSLSGIMERMEQRLGESEVAFWTLVNRWERLKSQEK